jgi:ribose-phosphate pyrophosphokinase
VRSDCVRLFGMKGTEEFASRVAEHLELPVSNHMEEYWEDKEFYVRSGENVRSCDCYVISSLYSDDRDTVAEKTLKLMFFVGSLFDASASRVTVVCPYMAFARQDRKNESRAPVYTKYLARGLTAMHCNRMLTMDVHNIAAMHNAFQDMQTDNLEAKNLLADEIAREIRAAGIHPDDICILSPDAGGMKRAERGRDAIAHRLDDSFIDLVSIDKKRKGKEVEAMRIMGDVTGKKVIAIDDMISTGKSSTKTQKIIEKNGGELWAIAATHGLFVGQANEYMAPVPRIFVTDTVCPWRLNPENRSKVRVVDTSRMFAQAIRRTHEDGGSISELLEAP